LALLLALTTEAGGLLELAADQLAASPPAKSFSISVGRSGAKLTREIAA
jgi:hypothetical protein